MQQLSDKSTQRRHLRGMLGAITPADRHARSLTATSLLTATPEFELSRCVMLFLSTPHEIGAIDDDEFFEQTIESVLLLLAGATRGVARLGRARKLGSLGVEPPETAVHGVDGARRSGRLDPAF